MENEKYMIDNIKSRYIFYFIFDFIKDENFKFKLFTYSKKYQNIFHLDLFSYKDLYYKLIFGHLKINIFDYFSKYPKEDNTELKNKLSQDLIENKVNDIKKFNNYVLFMIKKYLTENKNLLLIDIYSPFLSFISESDELEKIFLSIYTDDKYKLKSDYISFFNNLNNKNIKYPGISLTLNEENNYNFFSEINMDLKKIKKICLNSWEKKRNIIFKFLPFNNFKNNLVYLELNSYENSYFLVETDDFNNINEFKLLEELHLNGFWFKNTLTLKLFKLKNLLISNCQNIIFSEDTTLNIEKLYFELFNLAKQKNLYKFPELKICDFGYEEIYGIIDLQNLKKLKKIYNIFINDFIHLNSELLEEVSILRCNETKIFEKLISLKYLENISLNITSDLKNLKEIRGKNRMVSKLSIDWKVSSDCILYDIINLFPNLTELYLDLSGNVPSNDGSLEIKENKYCNIKKIFVNIRGNRNAKLYIGPYENITSFRLNICKYKNSKNIFPLFDKNCSIIFKNLKIFEFNNINDNDVLFTQYDNLLNLYDNLDKMPNIKSIIIKCFCEYVQSEYYYSIIKKLLSLNLEEIEIEIKNKYDVENGVYNKGEYSKTFLKKLYPSIQFSKYKKLKIKRL